jgi:membrane protein YqaA with SNARE-associated domain
MCGNVATNRLNPVPGTTSTGETARSTGDNPGIAKAPPPNVSSLQRGARPPRWLERVADWIAPGENPARVVYGIVLIGALLAAESGSHESFADTLGSALIALGIYWLAHAYSEVLGRRLASPGRLTVGMLWQALKYEWAIVEGAAIPLLALVLAWAAGSTQETAVTVALWSAVGSLILFELVAGIRSNATRRELALDVGVGVAMGLAIVALKMVLHH